MRPATARPGAGRGESRGAALAAGALLAVAIHAWLLFGVRIHLHAAPDRAELLEVALVAPAEGASPTPAEAAAPPPPARIEARPRRPPARAAPPPARPEFAPAPPEALPAPAGEPAPGLTAPVAAVPGAGPGAAAALAPGAGSTSARPRYKRNPEPEYPASARRRRQEGVVLLSVRVDPSGRPEAVEVRVSSGVAALDAAAVAAVSEWEFEPGRVEGAPVASQVEVPIHFELDRPAP